MRAAETFLGGGTDFQTPINAALELMPQAVGWYDKFSGRIAPG